MSISRAGRKRKLGYRQPNGQLSRRPRGETETQILATALAQPHRNGSREQMCGCAAGRFILAQWPGKNEADIRQTYYDTCNAYLTLVVEWCVRHGVLLPIRLPPPEGIRTGRELPDHIARERDERYLRVAAEIGKSSTILRRMIIEDCEPVEIYPTRFALRLLAQAMGKVDRKWHGK